MAEVAGAPAGSICRRLAAAGTVIAAAAGRSMVLLLDVHGPSLTARTGRSRGLRFRPKQQTAEEAHGRSPSMFALLGDRIARVLRCRVLRLGAQRMAKDWPPAAEGIVEAGSGADARCDKCQGRWIQILYFVR